MIKNISDKINSFKLSHLTISIIIFATTLAVYINNLSPSVHGGDSGDFITAAIAKGIPHPSGYPLYTMLGAIFTSLPISATFAWKYALVSSIFASLASVIAYLLIAELTKSKYLAVITSLTLSFNYTFWIFAEIVEVFSLHIVFILSLILITVKYINSKKERYLYYLAFLTGLSLTNNLSIILVFPAIALVIVMTDKKILLNYKLIFKSLLVFLLGLTPYLYIPIAASFDPVVNWGQVTSVDNLFRLIARKDYGWIPENKFSLDIIVYRLNNYFRYWLVQLNPILYISIPLGVIYLLSEKKYKILFLLLISFVLLGPFFVLYSGSYYRTFLSLATMEKFYLSSIVLVVVFFPLAISFLLKIFKALPIRKSLIKTVSNLLLVIISLVPITSFVTNFQKTNFKDIFIGDNYALDIIQNLPLNSTVFLMGDNEAFNSIYMQQAYNIRTDLYIPGRYEGLTKVLQARGLTEKEIAAYQQAFSGSILDQDLYIAIPNIVKEVPTFSDHTLDEIPVIDDALGKLVFIPYGLLYQFEFENNISFTKEQYLQKVRSITDSYRLKEFGRNDYFIKNNLIAAEIRKRYAVSFFNIGKFLATYYQDFEASGYFVDEAVKLDPLNSGR